MKKASAKMAAPGTKVAGQVRSTMGNPLAKRGKRGMKRSGKR